jgi:hypothetical protein
MGRKRVNEDQTPARLPAGTLDRIEAVLREHEKRADFIRTAIERELKRREGSPAASLRRRVPQHDAAHPSEVANRTMVQPKKNQKPGKK